ncbi:hypothetical protein NDU88_001848 [Pleurodeles waltl]|uniref:Uncharacterized protein n=1 Tax=Pleurodeles waltl TaxID=8319 RepID=A0AAV7KTX9_PLEWA|nr:hypothetical protein NDU88_001848 [Pleurodeles waltl]
MTRKGWARLSEGTKSPPRDSTSSPAKRLPPSIICLSLWSQGSFLVVAGLQQHRVQAIKGAPPLNHRSQDRGKSCQGCAGFQEGLAGSARACHQFPKRPARAAHSFCFPRRQRRGHLTFCGRRRAGVLRECPGSGARLQPLKPLLLTWPRRPAAQLTSSIRAAAHNSARSQLR